MDELSSEDAPYILVADGIFVIVHRYFAGDWVATQQIVHKNESKKD